MLMIPSNIAEDSLNSEVILNKKYKSERQFENHLNLMNDKSNAFSDIQKSDQPCRIIDIDELLSDVDSVTDTDQSFGVSYYKDDCFVTNSYRKVVHIKAMSMINSA